MISITVEKKCISEYVLLKYFHNTNGCIEIMDDSHVTIEVRLLSSFNICFRINDNDSENCNGTIQQILNTYLAHMTSLTYPLNSRLQFQLEITKT